MKTPVASSPVAECFTAAFRGQAHMLLALGIRAARPRIAPDSQEEHISGFIAQAIKECLYEEPFPWMASYTVHNEHPIPSDKRRGKERRNIDLVIELTADGRPEFVLEAKQLNYDKHYQRESNYTGGEGMGRFLAGDYATYTARSPAVGMLGYVLSDTAAMWQVRLKAAIAAKTTELALRGPQARLYPNDR